MRPYFKPTLAVLFISSWSQLHAQTEFVTEFKNRVLGDWNSLLGTINSASWEQSGEYHSSLHGKAFTLNSKESIRVLFMRNEGTLRSEKSESFSDNPKVRERGDRHFLSIANRQYSAELRWAKHADGWLLKEINQNPKDLVEAIRQRFFLPWMQVANIRLDQWLAQPGFSFARIDQLADAATTGLVRAHFLYKVKRGEWTDAIRAGHIDFDPKRYHTPVSYRFEIKEHEFSADNKLLAGFLRGTLKYENEQGLPVLNEIRMESKTTGEKKGNAISIEASEIHRFGNVNYNGHISAEEFKLSYYGLPEPHGVVWKTSSHWYLWLPLIALFCLCIGAYFWRRVRTGDMKSTSGCGR